MTISVHEKIHPLPGGVSDTATPAGNDMGSIPDLSLLPISTGKLPTTGSWTAWCFHPQVNKFMPGYAVLRVKGKDVGAYAAKVRSPLLDHPDGG